MVEYMIAYRSVKQDLIDQLALTDSTAHVHTGMMIYVFVAMIMRKRLHSSFAISAVILCALLNEVVDSWAGGPRPNNWLADIVNTSLWPLVIFTLARLRHERVLSVSRRHQEVKRKLLELEPRLTVIELRDRAEPSMQEAGRGQPGERAMTLSVLEPVSDVRAVTA